MKKGWESLDDDADAVLSRVVREFVEHWGMMAGTWGINASMGELFAFLYIEGGDWTADALRARLNFSRGNVSMNLRELISWGVVHKVHRRGSRRQYYRAETDVWTLFRRILLRRKRRELDPTLAVLDRAAEQLGDEPDRAEVRRRVEALRRFFILMNLLASRLAALEADELAGLEILLRLAENPPAD